MRDAKNIVYIQIQANALPNNLPSTIASQFLFFVPSISNPVSRVNIWIENDFIFVALTHGSQIPTYKASLIINSNILDKIYQSMGYNIVNVFVDVNISADLPLATINLQIPSGTSNSQTYSSNRVQNVIRSTLNSKILSKLLDREGKAI